MEVVTSSFISVTRRNNNASKNGNILFWLLFFMVMWYMSARCATMDALDLHRYYDDAFANRNTPIGDIVEQESSRGIDFIYYVILHFSVNLSIPLDLITALIVTLSYAMILSCVNFFYKGSLEWFVVATVLFLTPITWIIEISRNMTAILFLYVALRMMYRSKWIWAIIFCLCGLFTHFSVLMFIFLFAASYFVKFLHIRSFFIPIVIFFIFISSYLVPSYIYDLMSLAIGGSETVYNTQYMGMEAVSFSQWGTVGNGDKIPILYGLVFSVALLLTNKKQGQEFWMLMGLTVLSAFFVRSSMMFTNRCMMILPMFWALNLAQIYESGTHKNKKLIRSLCMFGLLPIFWHIFSYRDVYFPFFF